MFKNLARIGKAVGGLVTGGGITTMLIQHFAAADPRVGTAVTYAGLAVHGVSTAVHEFPAVLDNAGKVYAAVKTALSQPTTPTDETK